MLAAASGWALAQEAPPAELASPAEAAPSTDEARREAGGGNREPVPWDEEIERVVEKRYPRTVEDLRRIQAQVRAVVQHTLPAVVAVRLGDSVGSGVVVSPDGLVLTAGHVAMEPHRPVRVVFPNNKSARGVTLGINESIDSGMIQITDDGPWPYVEPAEAGSIEAGDWVVGLGQPNGFFKGRAPPVRLGRVLYKNNEVVSTDCTLVGGDSGGPLMNLRGEVVGIHSRIGRRITSNFHVPIGTYLRTWDRLLAGEIWGGSNVSAKRPARHAWLGLSATPNVTPCRVVTVYDDNPADRAGVKVGDVITGFDGEVVESLSDLQRLVLKKRPRETVTLTVERQGKKLELQVRLALKNPRFLGSRPADSEEKE